MTKAYKKRNGRIVEVQENGETVWSREQELKDVVRIAKQAKTVEEADRAVGENCDKIGCPNSQVELPGNRGRGN